MGMIDFLKLYPHLYTASNGKALFVTSPKISFLSSEGKGSSMESEEFQNAMQVLVGMAFSMKCHLKYDPPTNFVDYTMPPVEVIWYNTDKKKSEWKWQLLLPQPSYINEEMVNRAFEVAKKRHPEQVVSKISLVEVEEGICIQTLHTGSYEQEKITISFLKKAAQKYGYQIGNHLHEVYINDPRRTVGKKLQTIIRLPIKPIPGKAQPFNTLPTATANDKPTSPLSLENASEKVSSSSIITTTKNTTSSSKAKATISKKATPTKTIKQSATLTKKPPKKQTTTTSRGVKKTSIKSTSSKSSKTTSARNSTKTKQTPSITQKKSLSKRPTTKSVKKIVSKKVVSKKSLPKRPVKKSPLSKAITTKKKLTKKPTPTKSLRKLTTKSSPKKKK